MSEVPKNLESVIFPALSERRGLETGWLKFGGRMEVSKLNACPFRSNHLHDPTISVSDHEVSVPLCDGTLAQPTWD